VQAEFFAKRLATRPGVIAQEFENGRPSRKGYRMAAYLPILYCRLIDTEYIRHFALDEMQIQSALS